MSISMTRISEFSERHPQRSWTLILQQAWSFHLRDGHSGNNSNRGDGHQSGKSNKKESCWRYNQGRCTYGTRCKFEHKCAICGKYGHSTYYCRRASVGNRNGNNNHKSADHQKDKCFSMIMTVDARKLNES